MKCKQCGQDFEAKRQDAQFCSDKCRKALSRTSRPELSRTEQAGQVISDKLVPGNKNIYQKPDGSRYIIDALGRQHDWPLPRPEPLPGYGLPVSVQEQIISVNGWCKARGIPDDMNKRIKLAQQYQETASA